MRQPPTHLCDRYDPSDLYSPCATCDQWEAEYEDDDFSPEDNSLENDEWTMLDNHP